METAGFSREENIGFWKNFILVITFFIATPLTLGISLYSLFSLKSNAVAKEIMDSYNIHLSSNSGVRVFASLPTKFPVISEQITSADARYEIIRQYLNYYKSPLEPFATFIVQTADKYLLDFRLIPAIAQQESNLCKIIPPNTYNCWGWGIHKNGTLGFSSFEEGIEEVSKGLRNEYLNKGYKTVDEIMSKYTPSSNGSWAYGVNQFMNEMQ